jgi:twitching motility protein PilT
MGQRRAPRPDPKLVAQAAQRLSQLEAAPAVDQFDELLSLLDHAAWPVRKRAEGVLASLGSPVVERIKQLFLSLSENQRYWSMRVIARVLGAGALGWLKQLARHHAPAVRGSIISAVSEIPGDEATEFLFAALADDAWPNRNAAAEHLERRGKAILPYVGRGVKEGSGDTKYWSLKLLVRVLKEEGMALLSQCLEHEDATLRYYAIMSLGESHEEWALSALARALADPSWPNRRAAAQTLAQAGKPAVKVLVDALKSADPDVLYWSLKTLGEIGDERMVAPAGRLTARPELDAEVKDWVVDALAGVRSDAAAKRLIEIGADDEAIRQRAGQHLKGFGLIAVRPLLRYLKSTNTRAKEFAVRVLRSLGYPGMDALIAAFEELNPTRAELIVQGLKRLDAALLEDMFRKGTATADRLHELATGAMSDASVDGSTVWRMPGLFGMGPGAGAIPGAAAPGTGVGDVTLTEASVSDLVPQESAYPVTFDEILGRALEQAASDIHIRVGQPPVFRLQGVLKTAQFPPFTEAHVQGLLKSFLSELQRTRFRRDKELDIGYEIPGVSRFRVNVFSELSGTGVVARVIPSRVPSLTDLSLPPVFQTVCSTIDGLILVTGPTGSGKSTTLAAMIDYINETRDEHILTIEDPVEFRHAKKRALMSYRELGKNTRSFSKALRSALREDPDVILVGELRDRTTISLAVRAAETGHLVLGTLHTSTAAETVDRIVNVFPGGQQAAIRTSLAAALKAVICQHLVPSVDGKRVAALEILLVNFAVANLIREQKLNQIDSAIMAGRKDGMISRDDHLAHLVRERRVRPQDAIEYAHNKTDLEKYLKKL